MISWHITKMKRRISTDEISPQITWGDEIELAVLDQLARISKMNRFKFPIIEIRLTWRLTVTKSTLLAITTSKVKQSFQSDSDTTWQDSIGLYAGMQFRSHPTVGIRLKWFRQLTVEIRSKLFESDGIWLGIIDLSCILALLITYCAINMMDWSTTSLNNKIKVLTFKTNIFLLLLY
jgi:hypothetical protein